MKKVVLLTEIISPYRIPVFNQIAQSLKDQFLVLFLGETEKRRDWKIYKENIRFSYEVLPHFLFQNKNSRPYFFNPTLLYKLLKYSPDILIIAGYHHPSYFLAMLYAKFFRKKIILWCESNIYEYRLSYPFKEAYKRWFVKNCTGYIVPGKASFEYLISLGAKYKKIWTAPNAVDNDYFSQAYDKHRKIKEIFKQSKGYPKKLILYVGSLIRRKGIFDLLKAFKILSCELSSLGLILIGSGEEEKKYREFCKINNLKNVYFEGFMHQEKLAAYYAASDVFVLPAYSEPWGLVLNEAMASGLPVISSDVVGAAGDLIINGVNGYIFKKGDTARLIEYIKDILNDDEKRARMGQNSLSIIKDYSPLKCAEGFIRVVKEIKDTQEIKKTIK